MKRPFFFAFTIMLILIFSTCTKEQFDYKSIQSISQFQIDNHNTFIKNLKENRFFAEDYIVTFNPDLDERLSQVEKAKNQVDEKENFSNQKVEERDITKDFLKSSLRIYFENNRGRKNYIQKHVGFPIWSFIGFNEIENGNLLVIPLATEVSPVIEGILLAYINESNNTWKFQLIDKDKISKYKNKEKAKTKDGKIQEMTIDLAYGMLQYYNYELFGLLDCELVDIYGAKSLISSTRDEVCVGIVYEETTCYCSEGGGETYCYDCVTTYSIEDEVCTSGPGSNLGSIPSGGGSGFTPLNGQVPVNNGVFLGDAMPCPEINPTPVTGVWGGRFGYTRVGNDGITPKWHNGLDLAGNIGDHVHSMYHGTVIAARNVDQGGCGKFVVAVYTLNNGDHLKVSYCHLNQVFVPSGASISAGDVIGEIGKTGNANSPSVNPHVHISIRIFENGNWRRMVDPEDYMHTQFDDGGSRQNNPC